jgi:uncharacterized protein YbjT (DUF2867 family)
MRVLVIGATSRVGRLIVNRLLWSEVSVRALTRNPDAASLPELAEVFQGDLTDPPSIEPALEDIDSVFLMWTVPVDTVADVVARIARDTGDYVRRIVYLSAPFRTAHPFFRQANPLRELHAEVERVLEKSGTDVAILRPGMFASNALHWWAPAIRAGQPVRWPYGAVETAPIDERDLASVAAKVLAEDQFSTIDCVLTGPAGITQTEQVATIGEAIGRPIPFEEISPDEFRRQTAGTWPPPVVEMLLSAWGASVDHPAFVTNWVDEVLRRPAKPFAEWAKDNAAAFK